MIKAAAEDPKVERIFVNAAIKKALCREAGQDRAWLYKVRPMWGHNYHFHIRLRCPADNPDCKPQEPPGHGDGCGADLDWWFRDAVLNPPPPKEPPKRTPPLKMADLPPALRWMQLPNVEEWIMNVPQNAAKRAILMGAALGVMATGLRVILGIERSYLSGED